MMRNELLQRIAALPADADVGIQIGDDHLDIAEAIAWGDGGFGALSCHSSDLRDLLLAWGLPSDLRERLAPGAGAVTTKVHDPE
jgi:hypothetical protein